MHLLAAEVDELRFSHNELEQYGRRKSLRINNFVLDTPVENEHELKQRVLYFLNTAVLKGVGRVLDESDIERCHFVGEDFWTSTNTHSLVTMTSGGCFH